MSDGYDRRRFLGIAGTGTAASLAGCTGLANLTQDDAEADDLLTVLVGPEEEEIQTLVEEVQAGETDPAEARQRQQELLEEAVDAFEQRADEESDLTVEESTPELGLFRVDADGELLIEALRDGDISSIHPGSAYDQILERQQQQQAQMPPEQGSEPGGPAGENDSAGGAENDTGPATGENGDGD